MRAKCFLFAGLCDLFFYFSELCGSCGGGTLFGRAGRARFVAQVRRIQLQYCDYSGPERSIPSRLIRLYRVLLWIPRDSAAFLRL